MKIRKFSNKDSIQTSQVIMNSLININPKDHSKEEIEYLHHKFSPAGLIKLSKERDIYVLEEKDMIIATGALKKKEIVTVFVDPECHRQGIGTKMVQHLETLAKKRGYKYVQVPSDKDACPFYKKLGYQKIKQVYDQGIIIIMRKTLK